MTPNETAAQDFANGRWRASVPGRRSRRVLVIAISLSVLAHLLPFGVVALMPPLTPVKAAPEVQGEVELLMVEQKGAAPSQAGQPSDGKNTPEAARPAAKARDKTDTPPVPEIAAPLPPTDDTGEAVPPPPAAATAAETPPAPRASPSPPPQQEALVFNFAGTDSDTNARVVSGHVLPAMPDDRFRNRPPPYPLEAAMRRETGAVLVLIHVSAYGLATGAEVVESSGSPLLDEAAVAAVRKWHFHPAMQEGQAVPFDMPFRFVFSAN
nr:energy transducer TonB [uncultured Rhodopila sp.]